MPTIQSMHLPLPQHWQEFEGIVRDAQANRWRSPSLQKNGRSGQSQNGVDIYGPDDLGRLVGIQCKRYAGPLKLSDVLDEIDNANSFKGQLSTLYIATTAGHDSKLQEQVRILSETRAQQGKFVAGVLFWDEIVAGLVINPTVLRAHYPQFAVVATEMVDRERQLAALELGYFGADLWEYVSLTYGEFGFMAGADPDELIATVRILEHHARRLLSPEDAGAIIESLSEMRSGCLTPKSNKSDWDPVEVHAKRASSRIQKASSLLSMSESNVLDTAMQLGRIYHLSDDVPSVETRDLVKDKVRAVLGPASYLLVDETFEKAATVSSGYQWARRIFTLLDQVIRYG
jgi:hypothetical protein